MKSDRAASTIPPMNSRLPLHLRRSPLAASLRRFPLAVAHGLPFIASLILIGVTGLLCPSAFAQQNLPNIAKEVKANERPKSTTNAGTKTAGDARRGTRNGRGAAAPANPRMHAPANARPPAPANARPPAASPRGGNGGGSAVLLTVNFMTGLSGAEIFLERNDTTLVSLGRTGTDGRLTRRLLRGFYQLVVSRPDIGMRRHQLEVRPGQTTFNLSATSNAMPARASAPPPSAAQVIERFLNPKTTDHLTSADWEAAAVQAAAAYAANPVEPQLQAQALFTEGQLAFLSRDYPTAARAFNHAALILPESPVAFYALGNAHFAAGQLGEAGRAYQRSIELNPQLALAHKGLGDVLARQGKHKEAVGYYERARALGYASSEVRLGVARALVKQRRWAQALREWQEISRTQPSAEAFMQIGDCFAGLDQPLSAAPAYRRAAELEPKSALAHYKLGTLVFGMREYREASEALERALALDPTGQTIDRGRARQLSNSAAEKLRKLR